MSDAREETRPDAVRLVLHKGSEAADALDALDTEIARHAQLAGAGAGPAALHLTSHGHTHHKLRLVKQQAEQQQIRKTVIQ